MTQLEQLKAKAREILKKKTGMVTADFFDELDTLIETVYQARTEFNIGKTLAEGYQAGYQARTEEIMKIAEGMECDENFSGHWRSGYAHAKTDLIATLKDPKISNE